MNFVVIFLHKSPGEIFFHRFYYLLNNKLIILDFFSTRNCKFYVASYIYYTFFDYLLKKSFPFATKKFFILLSNFNKNCAIFTALLALFAETFSKSLELL